MTHAEEIKELHALIREFQFYSRRYCDGRLSYAVDDHNKATDKALELGVDLQADKALDATYYAKSGEML